MAYLRHIGLTLAVLASLAQARPAGSLLAAREFYNRGAFDEAIAAASQATEHADERDAALVVLARAYLDRFRQLRADPADLDAAVAALKDVNADRLTPADRVEWLVGLGVAVYSDDRGGFEDRYSAAAELFGSALEASEGTFGPEPRERMLEWWCGALDWHAQFSPADGRRATYERMLARLDRELVRNDRSTVALYWRVAAARGMGDLDRAWGAAVAGWLRGRYFGEAGAALQADLDRFVMEVLLPERAQALTPDADPRPTLALLEAGWRAFKARWQPPARP